MKIAKTSRYAALGFLSGAACGAIVWTRLQQQYRRDLFNKNAVRRVAALGYLRAKPTVDSVRLLREYIGWERNPLLRHRGAKLLKRIEANLTR
ncbi:MAG: hypothetical protein H0U64_08985 [Gemmatimonadaceae bacterium]|nr:hypothetical protein [Gemmatimonadaceae bacterium]